MPHYCRICNTYKANEKFSGKGHRTHICKKCQKRPKAERAKIEIASELYGYLQQSNISVKNKKRLKVLTKHTDKEIAEKAALILEVAQLRPHKRRRMKFLAKNNRDLLNKLKEQDLIWDDYPIVEEDYSWEEEFDGYESFEENDLELDSFEDKGNSDELPF